MAIRNAFHRAGATIIDCNLTHMIAATVLYMIGSDQVKGFAVTLWLGVATSMYTAVFVARVIFDIAENGSGSPRLKMLRVIGHTNIDFMGWFPYCLTASILITVVAIVSPSFAARACSTSTSRAAFPCKRCSISRRIRNRCESG